jgi:beta-carotene/zeaxanthin 4-ketolase
MSVQPQDASARGAFGVRSLRPYRWRGVGIAAAILTLWAGVLGTGLSGAAPGGVLGSVAWILLTAFLYTGVFITAHDAMHALVAPAHPRLNHALGRLASWLYAAMPYATLHTAHHEHHAHPVTADDPDYHGGEADRFWPWYARFFLRYATATQFVVMGIVFNVLHHAFGVGLVELWLFWILPQVLSTFQLFGVGTWLPHRSGPYEVDDHHHARSLSLPPLASFLACYHFGYHYEHHAYPFVPWWRLPAARAARMASMSPHVSTAASLVCGVALLLALSRSTPAAASEAERLATLAGGESALSGLWVQRQDTTTIARIATIGRVRSTTTSIVLYEVRHNGNELTGSGRVCDVRVVSDPSFIATTLPDAFLRALPTPVIDARLAEANGTLALEQAPLWSVVGANLDRPLTEALPQSADDPRVCDSDDDGNPGVTVQIGGLVEGEVYIVQRGWSRYRGLLDPRLRAFRGEVVFGQEQVVLDASRRVLRSQPPMEPADAPGANTFVMAPLADGAGCREAVELALELGR